MDDETLSPELREAIIDWFEGFELVDLLNLGIEEVLDAFEDQIIDKLPAIKQEIHWKDDEDEVEDSE